MESRLFCARSRSPSSRRAATSRSAARSRARRSCSSYLPARPEGQGQRRGAPALARAAAGALAIARAETGTLAVARAVASARNRARRAPHIAHPLPCPEGSGGGACLGRVQ